MMIQSTRSVTKQQILDDLTAIRDKARLRVHLLSLDARSRWAELEARIASFERAVKGGGDMLAAASRHLLDLRRVAEDFLESFPYAPGFGLEVSEIMTRDVRTCRATDSLAQAAALLWNEDLGALPVVSDDGFVQGMLTDRDICMAAYTQGTTLHGLPVSVAMSGTVHACFVDDTLEWAATLLERYQLHRLPVLSVGGSLAGIVTLRDIGRFAATLDDAEPLHRVILRLLTNIGEGRRAPMSTAA